MDNSMQGMQQNYNHILCHQPQRQQQQQQQIPPPQQEIPPPLQHLQQGEEQQQQQQLIQHVASTSRIQYYTYNMPPGCRFCPTDEELIEYYLRRQINKQTLPFDVIRPVHLYAYSPEQLTRKYPGNTLFKENEWYFFTPRNRKYANGTRPNRSAGDGFWKPTGVERSIVSVYNQTVGYKKALDYYAGSQRSGQRTNWKMHEYRIHLTGSAPNRNPDGQMNMQLDEWVLCRIYLSTRKRGDDEQDQYAGDSIMNDNDDRDQAVQVHEAVVQIQDNNLANPVPSTAPEFAWPLSYEPPSSSGSFQMFDQNSFEGFNNDMFADMANFAPTTSAAYVEPNYPSLADSNFSDSCMYMRPIDGDIDDDLYLMLQDFQPPSDVFHDPAERKPKDGEN